VNSPETAELEEVEEIQEVNAGNRFEEVNEPVKLRYTNDE